MIPRPAYIEQLRLAERLPLLPVLTGLRRCGKSSILALYADDLLARGTNPSRILQINLESLEFDALRDYRTMGRSVAEKLPNGGYLLLDEAQEVDSWERLAAFKEGYHGVLTLVERATGFAIVKKISCRTATEVAAMAKRAIARHRKRFRTLTLDNGTEFHNYKDIELAGDVVCYFATPYHSWERGTNENFNGLLRQYLRKGTSMKDLTQRRCDWIADRINTRPRKRLDWYTPKEL